MWLPRLWESLCTEWAAQNSPATPHRRETFCLLREWWVIREQFAAFWGQTNTGNVYPWQKLWSLILVELLGQRRAMQNLPNSASMYLRIAYILCQWILMYKMMGHVMNLATRAFRIQRNLGFFEWGRLDSVAFPSHRCYTFFGCLLSVTHSSLSLCVFLRLFKQIHTCKPSLSQTSIRPTEEGRAHGQAEQEADGWQ